jgi:hypothetical protein
MYVGGNRSPRRKPTLSTGAPGGNLRCQRESPYLYHMRNGFDRESNTRPPRWPALMLISNIDLTTAPLWQHVFGMIIPNENHCIHVFNQRDKLICNEMARAIELTSDCFCCLGLRTLMVDWFCKPQWNAKNTRSLSILLFVEVDSLSILCTYVIIVLLLGIFTRAPRPAATRGRPWWRPFYFPGGALPLWLFMIPAPSGSHLECLKCVKTYGKTFYWP